MKVNRSRKDIEILQKKRFHICIKHELAACQILHTSDARCPVGQNRLGKIKSTVEDTGRWAQGHEDHRHHSSTLKHKESQKSSE